MCDLATLGAFRRRRSTPVRRSSSVFAASCSDPVEVTGKAGRLWQRPRSCYTRRRCVSANAARGGSRGRRHSAHETMMVISSFAVTAGEDRYR